MSMTLIFLLITIIILFVFNYNHVIDTNKFVDDTKPYFNFLMEDDYEFLLRMKYPSDETLNVGELFGTRVRNGLVAFGVAMALFLTNMSYIYLILAFIIAFAVFKLPYINLKSAYNKNLYNINLRLPYYLKGLEILIQHYTVPVAISKSIATAPEIFRPGLKKLVEKIESGDSSVDPYMDFAKEYPVRDSMRMMRLLYRLSLGSQENKQEQLMMFSKNVSTLQNKAREQKYKNRLETMENKTMMMLFCTGGGIILLLMISMTQMMGL